MKTATGLTLSGFALGIASGLALAEKRRRARFSFEGRSVIISGGSRGLGLVLARQLANRGARIALLARDADELIRAEEQLIAAGGEVMTVKREAFWSACAAAPLCLNP